jgi:tRNA nucleotidyltransferase (CCA-adding enzyme)
MASYNNFNTVMLDLGGHRIDVAGARTEFYPHPGALPVVEPASSIEADLVRRDFSINAMAILLGDQPQLVDPHNGYEDLRRGVLRVLHSGSFSDDPTRAIRAARYMSRLGFTIEPETESLLLATNLSTISDNRRRTELERLAREETGVDGLELLASWGLIDPHEGGIALAREISKLLENKPWEGRASKGEAILAAALDPLGEAAELAAAEPERPSQAVALVGRRDADQLILARALGAEWLDRYMAEWRQVSLEIDGADLLAAGVPEGPAVGRGLQAALRRKLDGEIGGREQELAAALEAAKER